MFINLLKLFIKFNSTFWYKLLVDRLLIFGFDMMCKENNGGGADSGRNYCMDADTVEKEDSFAEAVANFEIIIYADTAIASAYD